MVAALKWLVVLGALQQIFAPIAVPAVSPRPLNPPAFTFHHLHLNGDANFLITFYERLFDAATTSRIKVGGVDALRAGRTLLVINRGPQQETPTALWHFGWGSVSLGETYLAHAGKEVAWEPPLPHDKLHLHLRSVRPTQAAAWYHNVLGLPVDIGRPEGKPDAPLPPPEFRIPEALVRLGDIGMLIYRTEPPLVSSRGHRIDHLAIETPSIDAALEWLRGHGVKTISDVHLAGDLRVALIEGPDSVAIEIVEAKPPAPPLERGSMHASKGGSS